MTDAVRTERPQPGAGSGGDSPAGSGGGSRLRVPTPLQVLGGWGWRITAIAAGGYVLLWIVLRVWVVVLPLVVSLFLAAAVEPVVDRLRHRGVPSALATSLVVVLGLAAGALLLWWLSNSIAGQFDELVTQVEQALTQLRDWLSAPPLSLSDQRLAGLQQQLVDVVSTGGGVVQSVLDRAPMLVQVLTGAVLILLSVFFLLKDGRTIGAWMRERIPQRYHRDVSGVTRAIRNVMRDYLGGTVVVGLFNAVLIGLVLLVLGVPLVLPLAVITFLGSFVPLVGAFTAGGLSVLVALVSGGLATALWVAAATVVVQQIEGNLLQPLVMGQAVSLHPLVILYAVTAGFVLLGVIGGFLAVPVTAMIAQVAHYYRTREVT